VPERPEVSASLLPDDWSSTQAIQLAATPLGQLNVLAIREAAVTVPATLLDETSPQQAPDQGLDQGLSMLQVRVRLLRESTPASVRDRVWQFIGHTARTHRQTHAETHAETQGETRGETQGEMWNLFALGVAYPGLRLRARKLTEDVTYERAAQVHFNLAAEFLFALHRLDLDTPSVASRLMGAAYDQASGRKQRKRLRVVDIDDVHESDLPQPGGPDTAGDDPRAVLARLVAQNATTRNGRRLTERHAALIARTYLDGYRLYDVAADLHLSPANASKHRARAATIIATLLGHPELARHPTQPEQLDPASQTGHTGARSRQRATRGRGS
jgi:hypothetical protein